MVWQTPAPTDVKYHCSKFTDYKCVEAGAGHRTKALCEAACKAPPPTS
eukprot:gene9604-2305_t